MPHEETKLQETLSSPREPQRPLPSLKMLAAGAIRRARVATAIDLARRAEALRKEAT